MLGGLSNLQPEEEGYLALPWHSTSVLFRPYATRDLRDYVHWKVVLQLIAAAGIGDIIRRQVHPMQETVTPVCLDMLPPGEVREEINCLERRQQELRGQQ